MASQVNLRTAMIMDDYGDESYAKMPVNHRFPEDVTKEELDYYGWIYPFMEPTDLLFYLYPIALEFEKDKKLDCIDSLFYSLNDKVEDLMSTMCDDDISALKNGLLWVFESDGLGYADWDQCKKLQKVIGIKVYGYDYWESI